MRHSHFSPGHKPLIHPKFHLKESHVTGPLSFLNPTSAHYKPIQYREAPGPNEEPSGQAPAIPQITRLWRSRDNRKGRHAIQVDTAVSPRELGFTAPPLTRSGSAVAKGILRMFSYAPYWDVSYLVATTFTFGSAIWIINAFFVWLPLEDPKTGFPGISTVGGGVTAFIGATIFVFGSVLLFLEAVNENQTGCFGWALETVISEIEDDGRRRVARNELKASMSECEHHHSDRKYLLRGTHPRITGSAKYPSQETGRITSSPDGRSFRWIPSWSELRTHYLRELGFLASFVQLLSATVFWIAGFTGLPGIANHMSHPLTDGVYWAPQIVGGTGFILSGLLFTLETQSKWYIPAWHVLGWHIGFWNLIGGIGFTLCGALGPASVHSGVEYQATLSTFWGSWAFMVGSTIQWYESLQKHPVEKK
ncbi:hypothetical protein N7535_001309 [Penicillium sp. DV-2018c]|nr:hypothetical protein N7461_005447 [Penicillium sp. DV-2018c]KAJ5582689.1 hypothetical protein N7535_001309 [Penicillium sp. DV-2018c]